MKKWLPLKNTLHPQKDPNRHFSKIELIPFLLQKKTEGNPASREKCNSLSKIPCHRKSEISGKEVAPLENRNFYFLREKIYTQKNFRPAQKRSPKVETHREKLIRA